MSKFQQMLERVDADARELRPQIVFLTVIAAVLFAIGWLIGAMFRAVWTVVAWMIAAGKVGFKSATGRGDT